MRIEYVNDRKQDGHEHVCHFCLSTHTDYKYFYKIIGIKGTTYICSDCLISLNDWIIQKKSQKVIEEPVLNPQNITININILGDKNGTK